MSKTKTGTSIYVDDALRAPLIDFELEGKTTQANTPSPDNPSELVSVGYENLVEGSQDFSGTWVNSGTWETDSETYNGLVVKKKKNAWGGLYKEFNVEAGETYTFSVYIKSDSPRTVYLYNGGGSATATFTYIGSEQKTTTTEWQRYYITINVTGSGTIHPRVEGTNTGTTYYNYISGYQLEKSTEPHTYIPYGKYGIEVKETGKNIFGVGKKSDYTGSGLGTLVIENNTMQATITSGAGTHAIKDDKFYGNSFYASADYNYAEQYSVSLLIRPYDSSDNLITNATISGWSYNSYYNAYVSYTNNSFKLATASYIKFGVAYRGSAGQTGIYSNIMLVKGEQAVDYEPYQSNTQLYVLNEPLRSSEDGTIKDLLYIKNGMLYVDRKIGSIVLDGNESWGQTGTSAGYRFYLLVNDLKYATSGSVPPPMTSNYFVSISANDTWSTTKNGISTNTSGNRYILVNFISDNTDTVAKFKTWLSTHNTEVQYILAEPYTEEVGEINILNAYKGTNNIIVHSGIETDTTITYSNDFTAADKQALRNNTAAIKCKLMVKKDGQQDIELTENNSVKYWEYSDERLVPGKGFIGQFVGRKLTGNLHNISDDFDINGCEINLQLGIYRIADEETTWYDFGNFIVIEPEDNEVNDNTKFDTMDYTKLFNKVFDGNYTDTTFTTSYNDLMGVNLTEEERKGFVVTPVTARWVALYTCKQVGVELATTDFYNSNFLLDINPFQAGESCRDVMKAISQLALSWARIGWDNRCYIDFDPTNTNTDSNDELDNNQYFSLETLEQTNAINAVAFGMKNIDGETAIYIQDGTSGDNCLYLYDNPFLYSFALRQQAANTGGRLFGLTYMQLNTETIGHPWLTGTEIITVDDMEDNSYSTYPFNKIIKYSGHIRSVISSYDETKVEKTLAYTSDTIKATRTATIEVNKQEGRITAISGAVSQLQDDMGNHYTKEEINELISDELGLTNKYISSGGANKFRNTGLWYKEDTGTGYEYWTGSVDVIDDNNSASGTAMLLQNSTLTQTLNDVPNGKYTISFYAEKLNPTASLQVLINSTDYTNSLDNGRFEQSFTVSTNSIELSLVCDTNNGWKIWEVMCNVGEAPLIWMQHADEVRADTVNISKGITITSTTTDAVFKANADGIRIENRSKNTTTNFLEDGMETENATIKKQAKISGALHTVVGSQTWISGIL